MIDFFKNWLLLHADLPKPAMESFPAPYPQATFTTKKALEMAIKSELDVVFVMPDGTLKPVSSLAHKEIFAFVGPTASKIQYAGQIVVEVLGPVRFYHIR